MRRISTLSLLLCILNLTTTNGSEVENLDNLNKFVMDLLNTWDVRHCDIGYVYDRQRPNIAPETITTTNDRLDMIRILLAFS